MLHWQPCHLQCALRAVCRPCSIVTLPYYDDPCLEPETCSPTIVWGFKWKKSNRVNLNCVDHLYKELRRMPENVKMCLQCHFSVCMDEMLSGKFESFNTPPNWFIKNNLICFVRHVRCFEWAVRVDSVKRLRSRVVVLSCVNGLLRKRGHHTILHWDENLLYWGFVPKITFCSNSCQQLLVLSMGAARRLHI